MYYWFIDNLWEDNLLVDMVYKLKNHSKTFFDAHKTARNARR